MATLIPNCPDCGQLMRDQSGNVWFECSACRPRVFIRVKDGFRAHSPTNNYSACLYCTEQVTAGSLVLGNSCPGPARPAAPPPAAATSSGIGGWMCPNTFCHVTGQLSFVSGKNAVECGSCGKQHAYQVAKSFNSVQAPGTGTPTPGWGQMPAPAAPPPSAAQANWAGPPMVLTQPAYSFTMTGVTYDDGWSTMRRPAATRTPAACRSCSRELCAELDAPVYRSDDASVCARCRNQGRRSRA